MPKTLTTAPTAAQLTTCATRDAARDLLPLTLTKAQLTAIAAEFDMGGVSRYTKADLIERIVERAVGFRINHDAILNTVAYHKMATPVADARAHIVPTATPIPAGTANLRRVPTAADLRALAAALVLGDVSDPAVLADIAAAAAELLEVATTRSAVPAHTATDADRVAADRSIALRAIRDTRTESGWSPMTSVRAALWHLPRAAQDALLIGMLRDGLVHPIPSGNLKPLTPADRDAALKVGDQLAHAIQVV